jgi:hypothetical protein
LQEKSKPACAWAEKENFPKPPCKRPETGYISFQTPLLCRETADMFEVGQKKI